MRQQEEQNDGANESPSRLRLDLFLQSGERPNIPDSGVLMNPDCPLSTRPCLMTVWGLPCDSRLLPAMRPLPKKTFPSSVPCTK